MAKKGQIRMTETIAVLFIFFVLILFGLVFYFKFQQVSFQEKQIELLGKKATDNTLKALFLPELICSRGKAETEVNCMDVMKLEDFSKVVDNHLEDYYFQFFSFATITVQEVHPNPTNSWVIYNRTKPGFTQKEPTFFSIALREEGPSGKKYRFGYLKVEAYQ